MLALDGGGIRGLISLGILERIETLIREYTGKKLCEYFDYVGGTSTGSIIAAGIARGLSVSELVDFYKSSGEQMFEHSCLVERVKYFYTADPLKAKLGHVFGLKNDLDPDDLK